MTARSRWVFGIGASTGLALFLGLVVAPPDAVQGNAQRFMYIHVPSVWTAYLCFLAVFLGSALYLRQRDLRWDNLARACADAGVVLTGVTIATGMVWGSLTWGTPWTWDARLVSTAAMFLIYIGYLAVRHLTDDARRGARWAAVVGLGALLTVPLVHFSVLWWRTLHQPPTILGPTTSPPIHPLMALALAAAVVAIVVITAWAISRRYAALTRRLAESTREAPA